VLRQRLLIRPNLHIISTLRGQCDRCLRGQFGRLLMYGSLLEIRKKLLVGQ
jgi:hypothetical protein